MRLPDDWLARYSAANPLHDAYVDADCYVKLPIAHERMARQDSFDDSMCRSSGEPAEEVRRPTLPAEFTVVRHPNLEFPQRPFTSPSSIAPDAAALSSINLRLDK